MGSSAEVVIQHGTHEVLTSGTESQDAPFPRLDLDAIIVPASRPAEHLDHAVMLARAADCWLLVLCSKRLRSEDARKFLAARSFHKAIVVDVPAGYRHELFEFSGLLSLAGKLPDACGSYVTDLSMKRNIGLVLARMLRWRRVFFLDDDIRDIAHSDLQDTVAMLGAFAAAGMWVTDFPDNSIVCHANRMTGAAQDVFVSGAALAVNCDEHTGFFPDIYNEDWFFFFDHAAAGSLANSHLKATQICYYPFTKPQRAAWQEFGDVIAEGLYTLLHLGRKVEEATQEYWTCFLAARRTFLKDIKKRSRGVHPDLRKEMLASVQSALESLRTIKPEVCERYVQLWRQDLAEWKWRIADLPQLSIEKALHWLGLTQPPAATGVKRPLVGRLTRVPGSTAGRVAIPRFDTLSRLPRHVTGRPLASASAEADKQDPALLKAMADAYSQAMLAAKVNGIYSLWPVDEAAAQLQPRPRFGTVRLSWLKPNVRPRRRPPALPVSAAATAAESIPQPEPAGIR